MLKVCPKCGKVISYNFYFKAYICEECGYEEDVSQQISFKTIVSSLGVTIPDEIMVLMDLKVLDEVDFIFDKETKTVTIKKSEKN